MQRTIVVRYEVRPETAEENQRLVENVFAQLAADNPDGLRYATYRLADKVTFVHVAVLDDDSNPLLTSSAFTEFQRGLSERVNAAPVVADATVIGSYRFTAP